MEEGDVIDVALDGDAAIILKVSSSMRVERPRRGG